MRNKQLGDLGEDLAAKFLARRGYEILTRKYRSKFGELDIVARDKDTLVFVEVRSKSSSEYGLPQETIDGRKKERLRRVAVSFQARFSLLDYNSRFDCVAVVFGDNGKVENIELIKDAFWS